MWKRFEFGAAGPKRRSDLTEPDTPGFWVYRVQPPGQAAHDVVSLLPPGVAFESGIEPQAVIGGCSRLLEEGEGLTPRDFRPNRVFVDLLHDVIARDGPNIPGLQEAARRQGEGYVYVIDARTPTPDDEVPPHDVIGAFEVRKGAIVPGSYRANPNHQLLSIDGLFKLAPALHQRLMERISASLGKG